MNLVRPQIAALYVATDGAYFGVPGIDPWDEARDARKYAGPWAVIAHPPCQRWGRYWSGSAATKTPIDRGESGHAAGIPRPANNSSPRLLRMNFKDGLCDAAKYLPACPARVGEAIDPMTVVAHTTDMPPETFDALLASWQKTPGKGDCAHFVIGRTPADGLVQLVPINRNANHAGGDHHGWIIEGGKRWHPNEASVGIELHCAGRVELNHLGCWYSIEDGTSGKPIPASDVIPDPDRPGRGWHCVTEWQYQTLEALITALLATMRAPHGVIEGRSPWQTPAPWAVGSGRVLGHCSLDFLEREDPHQPTMQRIRALYGSA